MTHFKHVFIYLFFISRLSLSSSVQVPVNRTKTEDEVTQSNTAAFLRGGRLWESVKAAAAAAAAAADKQGLCLLGGRAVYHCR